MLDPRRTGRLTARERAWRQRTDDVLSDACSWNKTPGPAATDARRRNSGKAMKASGAGLRQELRVGDRHRLVALWAETALARHRQTAGRDRVACTTGRRVDVAIQRRTGASANACGLQAVLAGTANRPAAGSRRVSFSMAVIGAVGTANTSAAATPLHGESIPAKARSAQRRHIGQPGSRASGWAELAPATRSRHR